MSGAHFRRIALSLPDTAEGSHFDHPDFRVNGKIFATLFQEKNGFGVLLLTPDQQQGLVQDAPELFKPVPGGWGKNGSTLVSLDAPLDILEAALQMAWRLRVEKSSRMRPAAKRTAKTVSKTSAKAAPKAERKTAPKSAARTSRRPAAKTSARRPRGGE